MLRVLLTNDDGIEAEGINTLRRALAALDDITLAVVAPDENQSATARSISIRRPLWVQEVPFEDGSIGFSCDGTPVDCVRLAALGLIDGFEPDLIVAGINHGANLGRRHHLLGHGRRGARGRRARHPEHRGLPAVAEARARLPARARVRLRQARRGFVARVVDQLDDVPLPAGMLLNINVPAGEIAGVELARLGKRIYQDRLDLIDEDSGRKRYRVYGEPPLHDGEPGTDLRAVTQGKIAVTPLHFDLTAEHGMEALRAFDLAQLLQAAE